jgi:hypothetical protein
MSSLAEILGYLSLPPFDLKPKGLNMIPTNISLDGQKLTLLEAQLMEGEIQQPIFVEGALSLGVPSATGVSI